MKSVLFISYFFPPIISSGVYRNENFAKNLSRFGWAPTVLTVDKTQDPWQSSGELTSQFDFPVIRFPENRYAKWPDLLHAGWARIGALFGNEIKSNRIREIFHFPDQQKNWKFQSVAAKLAAETNCIFVSSTPFSSACVSCNLKEMTGKPLVVDFRDPWMQNSDTSKDGLAIVNRLKYRLEERIVKVCDRLILNTPDALRVYQEAYPKESSKMRCIPNGFDQLNVPEKSDTATGFRIVHTGSFYGTRTPLRLLRALDMLAINDVEFVHVGALCDELSAYKGGVSVLQTGPVQRSEALEMIKSASLLFLSQGFEHQEGRYPAVAGKTYEYLATGLPILAEAPPGDNSDIVAQYCSYPIVVSTPSITEIFDKLRAAWPHLERHSPNVLPQYIQDYSRLSLTEKLVNVLNETVSSP